MNIKLYNIVNEAIINKNTNSEFFDKEKAIARQAAWDSGDYIAWDSGEYLDGHPDDRRIDYAKFNDC